VAARPVAHSGDVSKLPPTSSEIQLAAAHAQPANVNSHQHSPVRHEADAEEPAIGKSFVTPPEIPPVADPLVKFGQLDVEVTGAAISLDDFEAMACQNNPTLLQARAQVQGALGEAIQAGLWPNPRLRYVAEQIGVNGTPGEFQGGMVQQRFVTARKLDLSRQKYLALTRVAEWIGLAQQYRVLNDVRIHYYRARGHQELLTVEKELLKNTEDDVVTRREMYNLGQATRAELHQVNVRLQRQRLKVLNEENESIRALEELNAVVGVELAPAPLATPLEGELLPIQWEDALDRLLRESPQMMAARNKLDSDRITVQREIAQPVPDIVLEGGAGHNFEVGQTTAAATISIDVPVFDWNQGTIRQAEADFARQQGEVRRTALMLRQELAREYRTYLTALQHVQNYRDVILPESRSAYELLLRSYKDNRAPWADVLLAEEEYFSLRTEYITNLIAWRESEVRIVGYLLHDGLHAPSDPAPPGHIDSVPKPR